MQTFALHHFRVGQMAANCYFLVEKDTGHTLIIDPGDEGDFLSEKILELKLSPVGIFFTHGHFDHVGGALPLFLNFSTATPLPVFLHPHDWPIYQRAASTALHFTNLPSDPIIPQQNLLDCRSPLLTKLFSSPPKVIPLPGHTPGSCGLHFPAAKIIFSGDLIFADGSVGRTDFSYSSRPALSRSLARLKKLPAQTLICPGHDDAFYL